MGVITALDGRCHRSIHPFDNVPLDPQPWEWDTKREGDRG